MNVIELAVKDIIPYEKNPRRNDNAVDAVAESIKQFGFKVPCVVTKDHVLVTGHTRVKACKKLGIKTVPCVVADDLTDEQIKAFRLADNKVGELAEWDVDLLAGELLDLGTDWDMDAFGFESEDYDDTETRSMLEPEKGYASDRSIRNMNLDIYDETRVAGKYDFPILDRCDHIPTKLVPFHHTYEGKDDYDACVHFFVIDYKFECIWTEPDKNLERLSRYDSVITPDFSMYRDMPLAMQIWNMYRSRVIARYWQDNGLTVIPKLGWCDERSYDWTFEGLPDGGVFAVGTVGMIRDEETIRLWRKGIEEAFKRVRPSVLLCYGGKIEFDAPCECIWFDNYNKQF